MMGMDQELMDADCEQQRNIDMRELADLLAWADKVRIYLKTDTESWNVRTKWIIDLNLKQSETVSETGLI